MSTPEAKVKNRVKAMLKEHEPYLWQHWPVQAGYGKPCLDCHGVYNGYYFAIETKAPGKHPTPRQQLTIEELVHAGARVFVIGEKLLYKKGEPMTDQISLPEGKNPKAPYDIYSGMEELETWLQVRRVA